MPNNITMIVITALIVAGAIIVTALLMGVNGMLVTGTVTPMVGSAFSLALYYLGAKKGKATATKKIKEDLEQLKND